VPEEISVEGPDARVFVYRGGEAMPWRAVVS
jgi:hypothetical protein